MSRSFRHGSSAGRGKGQQRRNDADFDEGSEWLSLEHQPAAYYRAAAARARKLEAEATTPRLKRYLKAVIARSEQLTDEVEKASEAIKRRGITAPAPARRQGTQS